MNFRSFSNTNGWSAIGGQTVNPYTKDGDPCGSSSGSGVGVALGLAPIAIGTETSGSIVCPSSWNNIVGLKPTIGLVSRSGLVPISALQDSAGPMTQTVRDAAILLNAIVGEDTNDDVTIKARGNILDDYTTVLKKNAMIGARIGIPRQFQSYYTQPYWDLFENSINIFKAMGAIPVDVEIPLFDQFLNEFSKWPDPDNIILKKLLFEFKDSINKYLSTLTSIPTNATSLTGIIDYNEKHAYLEFPPTQGKQDNFIEAEKTTNLSDPDYIKIRDHLEFLTKKRGEFCSVLGKKK